MRQAFLVALLLATRLQAAPAVSLCDLNADPGAYDHKVIEVTAFVSHGFEDFTLFDPRCSTEFPNVWLEYGGTFASGTIYCCELGSERSRPAPLVVDGVTTSIIVDRNLKKFDALIQRDPPSIVHATLRGHFFAGRQQERTAGTQFGGFGHFGLFTLLTIEQVVAVDADDLRDVDYRAYADEPDLTDDECFSGKPPRGAVLRGVDAAAARRRR